MGKVQAKGSVNWYCFHIGRSKLQIIKREYIRTENKHINKSISYKKGNNLLPTFPQTSAYKNLQKTELNPIELLKLLFSCLSMFLIHFKN